MKQETCYKLTNRNLYTYGGFLWQVDRWHETDGEGDLCGPGWLHAYSDPILAVMMNPIHADFPNPRLFEARGAGRKLDDYGLKCGYTRIRLVKELDVPEVNVIQRVAFGILCALEVCEDSRFRAWDHAWLDGSDRSAESARVAKIAAARSSSTAAMAAEWATRATKADVAAWAAGAAARATENAAMVAVKTIDLPALARRAMEVQ